MIRQVRRVVLIALVFGNLFMEMACCLAWMGGCLTDQMICIVYGEKKVLCGHVKMSHVRNGSGEMGWIGGGWVLGGCDGREILMGK